MKSRQSRYPANLDNPDISRCISGFCRNEQSTDNGRALQWTNGLGSSNAFITLVSGPTTNATSGTESGNVSTNVWHSNDTGDVNFTDQSNTQQLLASTEKVQRNYGNADDNTANAHNEHTTVTAMSFSDHIYSPSNLITTTSESSVKPELDVVVVGGNAKSPSAVEDRSTKTRIIWTDDLREILIQEMKKRPCLWDHNHPKYRDLQYAASERNEVIESFYHRTGYALNADDIARQWKSLRDQYVRFINKIRNMEPNDCRFPSFKFSEELKFLMPYKQLPQSRYCIMMNEENGLQNLNENIPSKESCSEFSVPGTSTTSLLPLRRKRKHGRSSDYKTQKDVDSKTQDKEDSCFSRMDEFDHFGLSIADYIRGIAKLDEKAAVWIRGEIWTLLTKCRMKALDGCSGNGTS
uniref:MADF domain-containing protein n=1 Tax=Onchocerca volvulus TaxID=6282 RepID=A0A8R1XVB3_ONCVO